MRKVKIIILLLALTLLNINLYSQIDEIKDLAEAGAEVEVAPEVVEAGCTAFSCCWDIGIDIFTAFLIEHHQDILKLKDIDPSVLSLDIRGNFAYGYHKGINDDYIYINYLPGVRGNIGVFASDLRFNMLTEYTDDMPNNFNSLEWLLLLNIEPVETFRITFGSGFQKEEFTDNFYSQHYLGFKIGVFGGRDYIVADTRLSVDYSTERYPFYEAAINYNTRIVDFNFVDVYIRVGAIYQNYYSTHDIWAVNGGFIFNIH